MSATEREAKELKDFTERTRTAAEKMVDALGEMQSVMDEAWELYESRLNETTAAVGMDDREIQELKNL